MWSCDECWPDPEWHFPAELALPPCLLYLILVSVPFLFVNLVLLDAGIRGGDPSRRAKYNIFLVIQVIGAVVTLLISLGLEFLAVSDFLDDSVYAASERSLGYGLVSLGMIELLLLFCYQYRRGYTSTGRVWCYWLSSILFLSPTLVYTLNVLLTGFSENKDAVQMQNINHYLFLALYSTCVINFFLMSLPTIDNGFAKKHHPEVYASFVSQLTMWWANGMLIAGFKNPLTLEDIWNVRDEDASVEASRALITEWNKELIKKGYGEMVISDSGDKKSSTEQQELDKDEVANGAKGQGDVPDVAIKPETTEEEEKPRVRTGKPSMFLALIRAYKSQISVTIFYKFINDCLTFTSPKIMELFLGYMAIDGSAVYGVALALLLLVNNLFQTAFLQRYFYVGTNVGIRQRTALINLVYRKSLVLSNKGRQQSTVGQIVNLMSVDSQKFMDLMTYINLIWSAPLQIIIALILLYQQLGLAAFAGLAYMLMTMPINMLSGNKQKKLQVSQMKEKDSRVKLLTDILNGIKVLKLYAWERAFMSKVNKIRQKEISLIRKNGYLQAVTGFFWICGPYMVALFAFTAYILAGNTLYPTTAFVSIALFNILRFPMSVLPMMIAQLVQAKVAMDRLTTFFLLDELQNDAILRRRTKGNSIELRNCSFSWESSDAKDECKKGAFSVKFQRLSSVAGGSKSKNEKETADEDKEAVEKDEKDCKEDEKLLTSDKNPKSATGVRFSLDGIDFNVEKGAFFAILGSVGSGKSSLLNAVLGEMHKRCGVANVDGSVAYVGQQMWIRNATVRDNILFGSEFDEERYERVIEACALTDDLKILDSGDMTEIGEKGINLSGGQKARVSLARAVYSDRDIYLLDDPLAAVDAHVAAHIFEHVIGPEGLLSTKTRLLVTNKLHLLNDVDQIINLQDGRIKEKGGYCELLEKDTEDELSFKQLCKVHLTQQQLEDNCGSCKPEADGEKDVKAGGESKEEKEIEIKQKDSDDEDEDDGGAAEGILQRASRIFGQSQKSLVDLMSPEVAEEMKDAEQDSPFKQHQLDDTDPIEDNDNSDTDKKEKKDSGIGGKDQAGKKLMTTETVEKGNVRILSLDLMSPEVAEEMKDAEQDSPFKQHQLDDTDPIEDNDNSDTDKKEKKDSGIGGKDQAGKKLMTTETVEKGNVSIKVYMQYWKSLGYCLSFLAVTGLVVVQLFTYISMMWVARWSDKTQAIMSGTNEDGMNMTQEEKDEELSDVNFEGLLVYGLIGLVFGVIVVLNAITFANGNMRSSNSLHRDMLHGVMRSPLSFFETTPLGRITNRFGKDIDIVDNVITNIIKTFLQCILVVLTTIFAISLAIPAFLVVLVPLVIVYLAVLKFYVATSRQVKRIESMWKSPLYSNFGETLQGLTDIRAYQMNDYFIRKNQELVDTLVKTTYGNMVMNRWLAVRLECIGTGIVFATALILVFFREGVSAGNAGVAFTYAISCSQVLNWLCRMWSDVETNIVAVERIREYCKLKPEAKWDSEPGQLPEKWPSEGKIEVSDLEVKYREDLSPALKDVTCTFNPSEKIGIVGRTGSGKSTMTISLFRIVENSAGTIAIDSLDIKKLGLHDLRSAITIIPQDPVIFVGTIRDNLDPFDQYSDQQLWDALELSHLKAFVADLADQLEFQLGEGGTNISVGQRQLMCLARAILRKTKILVLDEATASVDLSTDELIQNTIRKEFKDSTVVTIAHRINTIMDSDRILVLERGSVREFGTLPELVESGGYFYSILEKENLLPSASSA